MDNFAIIFFKPSYQLRHRNRHSWPTMNAESSDFQTALSPPEEYTSSQLNRGTHDHDRPLSYDLKRSREQVQLLIRP